MLHMGHDQEASDSAALYIVTRIVQGTAAEHDTEDTATHYAQASQKVMPRNSAIPQLQWRS